MVVLAQLVRASVCGTEGRGFEPHIPPKCEKRPFKAAFSVKGHNGDTLFKAIVSMRPPSEPQVNRDNPNKFFIFWSHPVPHTLWHKYPRKRIRIKKYDGINRLKGEDREKYIETRLAVWRYLLKFNLYNPFEGADEEYREIVQERVEYETEISEIQDKISDKSEEDLRKETPIFRAFDIYLEAFGENNNNTNSVSTYKGTVKWLNAYFNEAGRRSDPINSVRRIELSNAVNKAKKDKAWSNTTFNKELNMSMTIFNWLAKEEYINKNPARGKIDKLKTTKTMHKWYDRETAKIVKDELIRSKCWPVLRASQFTYWILIRSKAELMKLKIGDIDRELRRVRFSEDLSKNDTECYRDYPEELEQVLIDMELDTFPNHFYVFGKGGVPSEHKCHKDLLATLYKPIRERLKLSPKHTIYSWKHTRMVHELMKGTDGIEITHMARHSDFKTTADYLKDFNLSLKNIYKPEDLTF